MIILRDTESDEAIGEISEDDLQLLMDELEEESEADTDYWIQTGTIDMLEEDGAPESLTTLLREALGEREGMEIQWSRR
jgi:processive 1,2-diacylglycerol beta-glucosyltransferase